MHKADMGAACEERLDIHSHLEQKTFGVPRATQFNSCVKNRAGSGKRTAQNDCSRDRTEI